MSSIPDLSVKLGDLQFANPIIAASGTFGYGLEFSPFVDLDILGGFCTKGLSYLPKIGNPVPRVIETSSGMLNSIGLENVGFEQFRDEKLPLLRKFSTRIICNFFGNTIEEYAHMAKELSALDRVDALEMNISCPNVEEGGVLFSSEPEIVERVVGATRKATEKLLIVKLSPNVTDITQIALAAERAGADVISLINTCIGMTIDTKTRKPYLGNETGGLSGPAIKPIALNMVYKTVKAVKIPVIGIGGIQSAEDALEFLMAGAKAIQVGTANFIDPEVTMKILENLQKWFLNNGISSLKDF